MGGLVASVTSVGKCAVAPAPLNKLCSHTLYYISFSKILMKIMRLWPSASVPMFMLFPFPAQRFKVLLMTFFVLFVFFHTF